MIATPPPPLERTAPRRSVTTAKYGSGPPAVSCAERTAKPPARPTAVPDAPDQEQEDVILARLSNLFDEMKRTGLTLTVLHTLLELYLSRDSERNLGDLSRTLGYTTSAITFVADRLEGFGLAERSAYDGDRRRIRFVITAKGKSYARWFAGIFAGLVPGRREMNPDGPHRDANAAFGDGIRA